MIFYEKFVENITDYKIVIICRILLSCKIVNRKYICVIITTR